MTDRSPAEAVDAAVTQPPRKGGGFRRWLAGGMLGLMLGAVLLGGTAFAQSDTDGVDSGPSFIDRLAEKLGLTPDELEATIKETQEDVIDDAVASGEMTEEQGAALKERIESGEGLFRMMPGRHEFAHPAVGVVGIELDTIASELGMTTEALQAELESGATLSEVITAHGSTVEAVVTALVADAETKLDEAVTNGDLTQEQADQMLTNMPERLTRMIENGLPGDCNRWFNGGGDDSEDTDGATETTSQV